MKLVFSYPVGRYQIRINFWFLIIFLIIQTLLNELGFWQLERAKEKQNRIFQLERGELSVLQGLKSISDEAIHNFQTVALDVETFRSGFLFLDNKIHKTMPGYHVLNIVRDISSGKYILVNRGWVLSVDRNHLPEVEYPDKSWAVKGRIYPLPEESISTSSAAIENIGRNLRLPVLDLKMVKHIEEIFSIQLESYILRLSDGSDAALETNFVWTNMPPEKHLAYAFQWFALAFAFLIVSLFACIKKGGL